MLHQDPLDFPPLRVLDDFLLGREDGLVQNRAQALADRAAAVEDLRSVTRDQLAAFFQAHYRLNDLTISIVGTRAVTSGIGHAGEEIEGLVQAVDAGAGTLTVHDQRLGAVVVHVDANTVVRKGDASFLLSGIQVGMRVHVKALQQDDPLPVPSRPGRSLHCTGRRSGAEGDEGRRHCGRDHLCNRAEEPGEGRDGRPAFPRIAGNNFCGERVMRY